MHRLVAERPRSEGRCAGSRINSLPPSWWTSSIMYSIRSASGEGSRSSHASRLVVVTEVGAVPRAARSPGTDGRRPGLVSWIGSGIGRVVVTMCACLDGFGGSHVKTISAVVPSGRT